MNIKFSRYDTESYNKWAFLMIAIMKANRLQDNLKSLSYVNDISLQAINSNLDPVKIDFGC